MFPVMFCKLGMLIKDRCVIYEVIIVVPNYKLPETLDNIFTLLPTRFLFCVSILSVKVCKRRSQKLQQLCGFLSTIPVWVSCRIECLFISTFGASPRSFYLWLVFNMHIFRGAPFDPERDVPDLKNQVSPPCFALRSS